MSALPELYNIATRLLDELYKNSKTPLDELYIELGKLIHQNSCVYPIKKGFDFDVVCQQKDRNKMLTIIQQITELKCQDIQQ